jgi:DNA-binding SARP family transcriptional activator/tetratricopeptide (TPR) repeat protein
LFVGEDVQPWSPAQVGAPRICALGRLRLRYDDREVPILGKPAHVVGALLIRREGISLAELLDLVWRGDPPKSARSALHVHLGHVRRLLADAPPGAEIVRSGQQYRLDLDGWETDLDLVEAMTIAASSISSADPATAAQLLEEALAMWCGPALLIDGEPISAPICSRFEFARLEAEEALVDALIGSGQLAKAEALAIHMVDAEPYRERRWGQMMSAQAGAGRIADALSTFRRARRRLIEDLGVEPGPELQLVEASILAREHVSVELPEDLDPPPRPLGQLIGRERLLERVETALVRSRPVVLVGAPGIGKTRLAVEIAARAEAGGRRVGWIDLRNAPFGDRNVAERVAAWTRSWPGGLVVLDNAETAVDLVGEILTEVRRTRLDTSVLITSQVPVRSETVAVALPTMGLPASDDPVEIEASESVRLLRAMLGVLAPNTSVTSELAADLCRRMGGLPFGIKTVADLARVLPLTEVARIAATQVGSEIEVAMAAVLEHLGEADRVALARLSTIAGNLDAKLVRALVGVADLAVIEHLIELGLMQFDPTHPSGPYSIVEPLREFLAGRLPPDQREEVLDRLVDHSIERARRGVLPSAESHEGRSLRAELAAELPWHRQAIAHLAERGDDQRALQIASGLDLTLYALGWWVTNTELQDAALAIPGPASSVRARVHAARGRPGLLHQFDEDHLTMAIEMADGLGDAATAAKASYHLGIRRWWERRWDEALELLDRAQRIAVACGDAFVEVEAVRFGGVVMVSADQVERGIRTQVEVLRRVERSRKSGLLVPHMRMYLGHCRRHIGDDDAAVADLESARADFERIGNTASLIHVCAGLAELYADRCQSGVALARAAQALGTAANGKISTYDPWVLCTIARVHAFEGDATRAVAASDAAVVALGNNWIGEIHRVAVELAAVSGCLAEHEAVARLIGVVEANEDRRELPFRTPAERTRLDRARALAMRSLGDDFEHLRRRGETSTVAEAVGPLLATLD